MRILFCEIGARSHFYSMVPLAWACRTAGHEVVVAGPPAFTALISEAGLPAVAVGEDRRPGGGQSQAVGSVYDQPRWPRGWREDPRLLTEDARALWEALCAHLAGIAAGAVDDLAGFARDWRADLVVRDEVTLAGAVAAAAAGVPDVCHLTDVPGAFRFEVPPLGTGPLPEYAALFDRFGCPPRTAPALTIDPWPPSVRLPVDGPCLLVRHIPYNGTGTAPGWLRRPRSRGRVCLTWGHHLGGHLGQAGIDPFREVAAALCDAGLEVVVLTSAAQAALLGELPPDAHVLESVPLHAVLAYCDAIVHHGGASSTLTACALGVPQLAMIRENEAMTCAERVAGTGAGAALWLADLPGGPRRAGTVAGGLQRLLADPAVGDAAARLRREVEAQTAPARLVDALPALPALPAPPRT